MTRVWLLRQASVLRKSIKFLPEIHSAWKGANTVVVVFVLSVRVIRIMSLPQRPKTAPRGSKTTRLLPVFDVRGWLVGWLAGWLVLLVGSTLLVACFSYPY